MVRTERKPHTTVHVVDNTLVMKGTVTLQNVTDIYQAGKKLLPDDTAEHILVDCQGVTHCDSGLLALLFAWRRDCKQLKKTLNIVHLSETVVAMAKLYDVLELLTERRGESKRHG